jgi:urease accessory protein
VLPESPALDLVFARGGDRTILVRRMHRWPYEVGRLFPGHGSAPATLIVQSGSGSIITGDWLGQRIVAEEGARVRVLGQGAMSVHRASRSAGSGETLHLRAAAGAWLENIAEPRVLFPGSDFSQETRVEIDPGAVVISVEAVVVHPEPGVGRYRSTLSVIVAGELVAREHGELAIGDCGPAAFAVVVVAGLSPAVALGLDWSAWNAATGNRKVYGAVSPLAFDAGVVVRVAAADGRGMRDAVDAALLLLRQAGGS